MRNPLVNLKSALFNRHLNFKMGSKRNVFNLSQENLSFLRIFQFLGFLPLKLKENEKIYGMIAFHTLTVFVVFLAILKYFVNVSEPFLVILFGWEIIMLLLGQVLTYQSTYRQRGFLKLLGEVDERFKKVLSKSEDLMKGNVNMQRAFVLTWTIYIFGSLYYPISRILRGDFSAKLFDSLSHVVTWAFLVHIHTTKFLYFYAIIAVRLDVIKQCLKDMQKDKLIPGHFVIREVSRDKFAKTVDLHTKIMALKEIYDRCWELQGLNFKLSGVST
jgi:hypothetical protein